QKEDFVAALSHDLKSPLIGNGRILDLLSRGMIKPERQPDVLNLLAESNKNMLELVYSMMDVYRSESGAVAIEMAPCNIAELA
ncbi:histidine kinase dimerization/phospho-acceptor domain-containing protein, partial [Acinetobacter baumannii]